MLSNKSEFSFPILIISLIVMGLLAFNFRSEPHYPNVNFTDSKNMQVSYLLQARINREVCREAIIKLNEDLLADCPTCILQKQQCLPNLTSQQHILLSNKPLAFPSTRSYDGVATYLSADSNQAINSCLAAEARSSSLVHKVKCHISGSLRGISASNIHDSWADLFEISLTLATAIIASWFICYLILRYENLHAHLSHDPIQPGIQKFHSQPTPRIGGIAIMAGLLAVTALEIILHAASSPINNVISFFMIASLPVFLGGITEDVTKNVSVAQRLLLSLLSAAIAIWLLGALINRTDIPVLDSAIAWLPFTIALTALIISGTCNAINIIDGYNGLSSGYSIITLVAMSVIAYLVNDHTVMIISLAMMGSLLGFMSWNWPRGKIFMGDGGAYLLGFTLAELAVLLLYRNPSVSPWAPFCLLAYPVFETLFSVYRRRFLHKTKASQPDSMHLHHLIFTKILRSYATTNFDEVTKKNSAVAPLILIPACINAIIILCFWQSTLILLPLFIAVCVLYVITYYKLIALPD